MLVTGQVVQGLYDYSTNMGMKQWVEATKPVDDIPYNGSPKGLSHFLASFHVEHWTLDGLALPRFKFMISLPNMDCTMCRMLVLKL